MHLISQHVQRVRDLTEQAANGTYGEQSKKAIESEITARLEEINRIAANCEFNGIDLMKGGNTGAPKDGLDIQVVGYNFFGDSKLIEPAIYKAESWEDVEKYLAMLLNGEDPLKDERRRLIKQLNQIHDGAAEKIAQCIIDDYYRN